MAAYGAAASLRNTIFRILQSSRISLVSHSPLILLLAFGQMDELQKVLLKLDDTSCSKIRTKVNALDELIKEAVWEFEDLLESHVLHQILPQLESERDNLSFSVELQSLQHHVDCFVEMVKMMEEEYFIEMENMAEEEGEPISSRIDFGGINSKMVGRSYAFQNARDNLLEDKHYSITGMAGVGKTTLAKHIFEDPTIRSHFEFRAWVKVGRKCEPNELLRCILAQVDAIAYRMLAQGDDDDEELVGLLKEKLQDKKCLIVLDDVWEKQAVDRLINCLREMNTLGGIQFLLTSRRPMTYKQHGGMRLNLLNEEDSKKLLGEKVFGVKVFSEDGFPPQLEKLGEKIAEKCEGLPLMIVIKDQRRLCAHYNSLFCFKQVCDSIKSDCASTARSLLYVGPYHSYPIPIHAMGFKLLRVLYALGELMLLLNRELLPLPQITSNLFHKRRGLCITSC